MAKLKSLFENRLALFYLYVLFGLVILGLCYILEKTDWGETGISKAFDFVIIHEAKKSAEAATNLNTRSSNKISDQIIFIDIDHQTFKKWGSPLITPRDKLAAIIKAASEGGAKIIIPDFVFENNDCYRPGSDEKLFEVLKEITDKKMSSKVIFPVRYNHDGEIQKNLFQALINKNPNFYNATADISAPTSDNVIRYWVPFKTIQNGKEDKILWNMAFLAAVIASGQEKQLREVEKTIKDGKLNKTNRFKFDDKRKIMLSSDKDDIFATRIRFQFIPRKCLTDYPDGNLFDNIYKAEESVRAPFKDKIVIIGNSSPDAEDIHHTPIGEMAGMFIIGNAMNTILQGEQPLRWPLWGSLVLEVIILMISAAVFAAMRWHSFVVSCLLSLGLLFLSICLSLVIFFWTGAFLNFVFITVVVGFLSGAVNAAEVVQKYARK